MVMNLESYPSKPRDCFTVCLLEDLDVGVYFAVCSQLSCVTSRGLTHWIR